MRVLYSTGMVVLTSSNSGVKWLNVLGTILVNKMAFVCVCVRESVCVSE